MQVVGDFELARIILALAMFGCASYFDLRKREVSDYLWIAFAAAAGLLYVFDFPSSYAEGIMIVTSMAIASAVSYGVYRAGLFGGADMLALITFSAIMPVYSFDSLIGIEGTVSSLHPFAPLIVLTNAVVFSTAQILYNLFRNLAHKGRLFEGLQHEPASKKILALMIGHRSENPKYAFSIERVVNGTRQFDFALKPAETAEYETRRDVWVTSATPFLVFMAAGFVMMVIGGDVLALLFSSVL
ncbi:MAG TPA: prepilin peptidase [Nitrososphaera sp.]|nr:prepilin peptidase [Nitrososphaera sp.]